MTPSEYANWLEQSLKNEIRQATNESAKALTDRLSAQIPSHRKRTRRALRNQVKHKSTRSQIRIGLHFSQRYPIRGTATQRLMRHLWRRNHRHVQPTLETTISKRTRSI